MRHTRSRSSSRCRCPFSNLQPPPSRTGRSIYTRRATACACDVLNLTREEVVASIGRPTHTSFFGTPPSLLPFPLHASRVCLSLSLFAPWPPSTSPATVRRASHAGRYRCPFDLPRSSRVRKSASVAWLSRSRFSRSNDIVPRHLYVWTSSVCNGRPLRTRSFSFCRIHIHTRARAYSYTCRASCCIEKKIQRTRGRGFRTIWTFNISIFAALPCVVWVRVHPRASVLSIQVSPVPGKTHLSSHVLSPKRNERNYSSKICPSSIEDRERKFTGNKGTKEGKEKKLGSRNTVYRHIYRYISYIYRSVETKNLHGTLPAYFIQRLPILVLLVCQLWTTLVYKLWNCENKFRFGTMIEFPAQCRWRCRRDFYRFYYTFG